MDKSLPELLEAIQPANNIEISMYCKRFTMNLLQETLITWHNQADVESQKKNRMGERSHKTTAIEGPF